MIDRWEEYFVADDDFTRVTKFTHCKCFCNNFSEYEHFRGFSVEVTSQTQSYNFDYGTVVDPGEFFFTCETVDMSNDELMFVTIFADDNDVEGFIWEGYSGTTWTMRANGEENERRQMGGRPIGFRVAIGEGGLDEQPLIVYIIYNACNCPASTYIGNNEFENMTIEAVVGAT